MTAIVPFPLLASAEKVTPVKTQDKLLSTRKFSLRYPANWVIQSQSESSLIFYNQKPPARGGGAAPQAMIKTDVVFLPGRFEQFPQPSRDPSVKTLQTQKLKINGRPAVREWIEGGDAFSNSIATYIKANDQETAIIISFYNTGNHAATEALIKRIHASFKIP